MKHNYLALAFILLILSITAGDTRKELRSNDKCIPGYSHTDNQKANGKIEKSKQEGNSSLNFSIGIIMLENIL